MYYSYRSRVGSSRFKKYYPKVADLNKEIGKYFTDKKDYYKGRMKKYNVRSRGYRVYFRYGRTHDGLLNCNKSKAMCYPKQPIWCLPMAG